MPRVPVCLILLFFTITFLNACGIYNRGNTVARQSGDYSAAVVSHMPCFTAYYLSNDSCRIYFKGKEGQLLFVKNDDHYQASFDLHYELYSETMKGQVLDSSTLRFEFASESPASPFFGNFILPRLSNGRYVLKLWAFDRQLKSEVFSVFKMEKSDGIDQFDFLLKDGSGSPVFNQHVSPNGNYTLESFSAEHIPFWVRCYFTEFPLPALPFRVISDPVFSLMSDSVFRVSADEFQKINFERNGIYYFQTDTSQSSGFTIICSDEDFPLPTRLPELIEGTRYLTTRKEFQNLMSATDLKKAFETFWIELAGNQDRAKSLINAYYDRMHLANQLFTSHTSGWRTDRGMVYMIFGSPASVFTDAETERWTYSGDLAMPDVYFVFRKMSNPFSENDYALIRQQSYEPYWYTRVEQWRQGRIPNDN